MNKILLRNKKITKKNKSYKKKKGYNKMNIQMRIEKRMRISLNACNMIVKKKRLATHLTGSKAENKKESFLTN